MKVSGIDTRNLTEKVYTYIRDLIISGQLTPGARINYEEFIAELGVSKTPLRDAFNRLHQDGLIEIRPRSGTFVKVPNLQDIEEIFAIRKALEREAVALALPHIPQERLEELLAKVEQVEQKIQRGDFEEFFSVDRELHNTIVQYSNNSRLIQIMDSLQVQIKWISVMLAKDVSGPKRANDDHKEILKAMMKKEIPLVQQMIEYHIEEIKQAAILNFS